MAPSIASVPLFEKKTRSRPESWQRRSASLPLIFVVIEIRHVNDAGRLLADRLHDPRMRMAEGVHAQPGHKVEILFAFEVIEENTFAALEGYGITIVGGEKKALFEIDDLFEARHGLILERRTTST